MSYIKAIQILPEDLLEQVQEYVDGEFLYIPRKPGKKKKWGSKTSIRKELHHRDTLIYKDYLTGIHLRELFEKYFLSLKSIQRIIRIQRSMN